jgi:GNAT superfamily N-acetyltransferase
MRRCEATEIEEICAVINDAATAYRGIIPADCWKEPYMPLAELRHEIGEWVQFWGFWEGMQLSAVMGLQQVRGVALIRHAYTRAASQRKGIGSALLRHLQRETSHPLLVGTWKAAVWAVAFYQRHGFELVTPAEKDALLQRYWSVPERQRAESVVLADARWFAARATPRQ